MTDFQPMGRMLVLIGAVCLIGGVLVLLAPKVPWLGRLPGDLAIERPGFRFYFPLTTCVVASLVISMVLWLVGKFR
jgi:hypothetical protein